MTVYQPGEDSFLLQEYLEGLELEGKKCLEIGTGSGILAVTMAAKGADVAAVDINPEAVEAVKERAAEAGLDVDAFQSDLFDEVDGRFDLVVFNPPYLPGEKGVGDEEIWRGGEKGTELTRNFLDAVDNYLEDNGFAIVVISLHADKDELVEEYGLEVLDERKVWFETLFLARYK
ncbi:MAG: HemK2/MTQ2 family protein methyltransferase [Candidatus Nanohaloarchaea archaeon]